MTAGTLKCRQDVSTPHHQPQSQSWIKLTTYEADLPRQSRSPLLHPSAETTAPPTRAEIAQDKLPVAERTPPRSTSVRWHSGAHRNDSGHLLAASAFPAEPPAMRACPVIGRCRQRTILARQTSILQVKSPSSSLSRRLPVARCMSMEGHQHLGLLVSTSPPKPGDNQVVVARISGV